MNHPTQAMLIHTLVTGDARSLGAAMEVVAPVHFVGADAIIAKAIWDSGLPFDPAKVQTLPQEAQKRLTEINGGIQYSDELLLTKDDELTRIRAWGRDIHTLHKRRSLYRLYTEQSKAISQPDGDLDKSVGAMLNWINTDYSTHRLTKVYTMQEAVNEARSIKKAWLAGDNTAGRVATGLSQFDYVVGGIPKKALTSISGLPKSGKTNLAFAWSIHMARTLKQKANGKPSGGILFFSWEMGYDEYALNCASMLSGVDLNSYRHGTIKAESDADKKFDACLEEIETLPIHVHPHGGITPGEAAAIMYYTAAKYGHLEAFFVDYAELGQTEQVVDSEAVRIRRIFYEFKSLAERFNAAGVILSQLNKSVEDNADRIPTQSDIRYAGIEAVHVAVATVPVWRYKQEGVKHWQSAENDDALLAVIANRNGDIPNLPMRFHRECVRWEEKQTPSTNTLNVPF